jgi:broad specificity phosphatase PhoE
MTKQTPEMVERQIAEEEEEEEDVLSKLEEELESSGKDVTEKEKKRMVAAAKRKTKKGKRVTIAMSQYEDDLIEQNYGNLAGVATISDAEHEKKTFGRYFYRYPNGERVADVVKRTDNFMKQIRETWDEKQNVLIVTHGVTFRAILMNLLQDIPGETNVEKYDFFSNPGNCTTVAFKWPRNRYCMGDAEWHHQDPDHDQHEKKKAMARAAGKTSSLKRVDELKKSAKKIPRKKKSAKKKARRRKGSDSDTDSDTGVDSDSSDSDSESDRDSESDDDSVRHRDDSDEDSDEESGKGSDDSDDESQEQTKNSDSSSSSDDDL